MGQSVHLYGSPLSQSANPGSGKDRGSTVEGQVPKSHPTRSLSAAITLMQNILFIYFNNLYLTRQIPLKSQISFAR